MTINICVLKSGGEYNESHVYRLAEQVPDLYCLTDIKIKGIQTIPMQNNWPTWWSKMELFNPMIYEDLFYIDLDSLVIKMPEMPKETTVLTDFGDNKVIASGLMYIKHKDKQVVWDAFLDSPSKAINDHVKWPAGDGGFLNKFYNKCQRWQNVAKVYSWKYHCQHGIPKDAEIICFHGKPRPWDIGL